MFDIIRMGAAGAGGAYEIEKSLRFNRADSAYLSRSVSYTPTSTKIATWSFWVKRCNDAGEHNLFAARPSSGSGWTGLKMLVAGDGGYLHFYAKNTSNSTLWDMRTTQVFRDSSAWYHVVAALDTTQGTNTNRIKLYVNGVQITSFGTATYPAEDDLIQRWGQSGETETIGSEGTAECFDGYMSEINYIDGQQLTPSSFGETNEDTGQWVPIKYAGAYGNGGFFLNFKDNSGTTASTLGKDSSANSGNFTPNNFSVSAGAGNDSLEDTPTNNFCTGNPLSGRTTNYADYSNGNLDFSIGSTEHFFMSTMLFPQSGKWYVECLYTTVGTGRAGVSDYKTQSWGPDNGTGHWAGISYLQGGIIRVDDSAVQSSLTSVSDNDIVGVAVNRDAGTVQFSINGTNKGSAVNISSLGSTEDLSFHIGRNGSSGGNPVGSVNFGQRPFANQPADFLPLCTSNLPEPTIIKPSDYFNTVLYTGNGGTQSITSLDFQPDLVWNKDREASTNHNLTDSIRGVSKKLLANSDAIQADQSGDDKGTTAFLSNGFTVKDDASGNYQQNGPSGRKFVAWCWKESATAGFDMFSYTGTGSNPQTRAHSLGVAPEMIIVKTYTGSTDNWSIFHHRVQTTTASSANYWGSLNTDNDFVDHESWNDTVPTSSIFTTQNHANNNLINDSYIAYLFASVEGYSKVGAYIGNGNADGPFVYTGFKPAWLMIKRADGDNSWTVSDNKRSTYNPNILQLQPDNNAADGSPITHDYTSNGFKIRTTGGDSNNSGSTYIYLAFAERPFKYATAR